MNNLKEKPFPITEDQIIKFGTQDMPAAPDIAMAMIGLPHFLNLHKESGVKNMYEACDIAALEQEVSPLLPAMRKLASLYPTIKVNPEAQDKAQSCFDAIKYFSREYPDIMSFEDVQSLDKPNWTYQKQNDQYSEWIEIVDAYLSGKKDNVYNSYFPKDTPSTSKAAFFLTRIARIQRESDPRALLNNIANQLRGKDQIPQEIKDNWPAISQYIKVEFSDWTYAHIGTMTARLLSMNRKETINQDMERKLLEALVALNNIGSTEDRTTLTTVINNTFTVLSKHREVIVDQSSRVESKEEAKIKFLIHQSVIGGIVGGSPESMPRRITVFNSLVKDCGEREPSWERMERNHLSPIRTELLDQLEGNNQGITVMEFLQSDKGIEYLEEWIKRKIK